MSMKVGDTKEPNAVMTFGEIGRILGISHTAAQMAYLRGIRKLRANPELFVECLELMAMLQRERREYQWRD